MPGLVPTIRATMLTGLDEILRTRRINSSVDELLADLKCPARPPDDIPLNHYLSLLERIAERTKDSCFGLTFARNFPVGSMKVFSYLGRNAPDLRTMISSVSRYVRLQVDALDLSFETHGGNARITWRFGPEVTSPTKTMLEFAMALCVDRIRLHSGEHWTPASARFSFTDPRATSAHKVAYAELFGDNLDFDAPICALTAPSALFDRRQKGADLKLFELMLEYADRELSEREQLKTPAERVSAALIDSLPLQEGNLESVAAALRLTPRQLQEELRRAGTNFEAVLVDVRKRLAKSYLATTSHSMTDIAMMLGFSELSAFTRATRNWYKMSPTELRAALREKRID